MPNAKFSVQAQSESSSKAIIKARNFTLTIDEPPNLGGTDHGANPVEFLLAALAGCLNVVGHMVAKEMGFTINSLSFELEGELNPAGFMGKAKDVRPGYQEIAVKVNADTDADEETLNKWLEVIESRCPVSDNISNTTSVKIQLK